MRTPRPCLLPTHPASRDMLLASGLSPAVIRTQLATGALVRVRTGVYIAASRWPDNPAAPHLVLAHAEQVAHPGAVMSHESAAVSWRLPHPGFGEWHEAPPSVTVVGELARSRRGPAVHHLGALPKSQVTCYDEGYDLTTIARTAVDLAAGLPLPEALVLLDGAARRICEALVTNARRLALQERSRSLSHSGSHPQSHSRRGISTSRSCPCHSFRRPSDLLLVLFIPTSTGQSSTLWERSTASRSTRTPPRSFAKRGASSCSANRFEPPCGRQAAPITTSNRLE